MSISCGCCQARTVIAGQAVLVRDAANGEQRKAVYGMQPTSVTGRSAQGHIARRDLYR